MFGIDIQQPSIVYLLKHFSMTWALDKLIECDYLIDKNLILMFHYIYSNGSESWDSCSN